MNLLEVASTIHPTRPGSFSLRPRCSAACVWLSSASMDMGRLTDGFSKRFDKHCEMLALYFHSYNFIRPHSAVGTKFNN